MDDSGSKLRKRCAIECARKTISIYFGILLSELAGCLSLFWAYLIADERQEGNMIKENAVLEADPDSEVSSCIVHILQRATLGRNQDYQLA